ncbi:hypothetical protein OSB04_007277 [Centaurea solstitialis]|uniref:Uncharacterized protein n=1 Tax=Centaurea solstitialis TaxID=347529 RepID=A0AA38WIB7_9ASTR|nr:hypothetical protein OSB04_007277 [Centaurea solstitialis]
MEVSENRREIVGKTPVNGTVGKPLIKIIKKPLLTFTDQLFIDACCHRKTVGTMMFRETFTKQSVHGRKSMLKKFKDMVKASKTLFHEPSVHKTTRGRPFLKKSSSKKIILTTLVVTAILTRQALPILKILVIKNQRGIAPIFNNNPPPQIHILIKSRQRVWKNLRIVEFFQKGIFAPVNHWIVMPEMAILTASRYNVMLHVLSMRGNMTYLPHKTPLPSSSSEHVVNYGFGPCGLVGFTDLVPKLHLLQIWTQGIITDLVPVIWTRGIITDLVPVRNIRRIENVARSLKILWQSRSPPTPPTLIPVFFLFSQIAAMAPETPPSDSKLHPVYTVSNIQHKVRVLDGTKVTYSALVKLFQLHARGYKVLDHIDGTPPPEKTNTTYTAWAEIDAHVLQWIYGTLSDDLLARVLVDESTAYEAWMRVNKIFLNSKGARAAALEQKFNNLKLESMSSLQAYCQRLRDLAAQLKDVDAGVNDQRLVLQLVRGLPTEFDTVASYIHQTLPSFETAQSMLELEQHRKSGREDTAATPTVLVAPPSSEQKPDHGSRPLPMCWVFVGFLGSIRHEDYHGSRNLTGSINP